MAGPLLCRAQGLPQTLFRPGSGEFGLQRCVNAGLKAIKLSPYHFLIFAVADAGIIFTPALLSCVFCLSQYSMALSA